MNKDVWGPWHTSHFIYFEVCKRIRFGDEQFFEYQSQPAVIICPHISGSWTAGGFQGLAPLSKKPNYS